MAYAIYAATLHFTHVIDDLFTSLQGKCGEKIINSLQKYNLKSVVCHIYPYFDAKVQKSFQNTQLVSIFSNAKKIKYPHLIAK